MKVILIEDIKGLGKKYEVKEVADGFGRNFLIPRGLVKIATKEAMQWLEVQREVIKKKTEEGLVKAQELVSKIDGYELVIKIKVGEKEQLFEKINSSKISEELKKNGFGIDKEKIEIEEISQAGEYDAKINFEHNLEANIKVIITKEDD